MKALTKKATTVAILTAMSAPGLAMADVTVYGKAHLAITSNSGTDSSEDITVSSQNSRFGVKGSQDLGEGLEVIYKMEWAVDMADNNGKIALEDADTDGQVDIDGVSGGANITARNQYVGLKGGFGQVIFGRHDTPMKTAQGKFDQFNDTVMDMKTLVEGEDRKDNIIIYSTPSFGKVNAHVALLPGEDSPTNDGVADGNSISITYGNAKKDALYVALAANGGDLIDDETRLVATYKMGATRLGLLMQTTDHNTADDEVAMGLSVGHSMGNGSIKFQYIDRTDNGGTAGADETTTTVGYENKLSKETSAYALYSTYDTADQDMISLGIVHNF